jgi:hypothetical protein
MAGSVTEHSTRAMMPGLLFALAAYVGTSVAPLHASMTTIALWSATAQCAICLPGLPIAAAGQFSREGRNLAER